MSIRLSDFDIDEEEWLPNPYQAQVDAQVRQSGWPSSSSATPCQWQRTGPCNILHNGAALPGSPLEGPWYPNACTSPIYCAVARPPGSDLARQQVAPIFHALTAHKIDASPKTQEHPSADGAQAYGTHMVPVSYPYVQSFSFNPNSLKADACHQTDPPPAPAYSLTAISDPAQANFPYGTHLVPVSYPYVQSFTFNPNSLKADACHQTDPPPAPAYSPTAISNPAPANCPFQEKLASQIFIAAYSGIRNGSPSSSASSFAVFNVARSQQYERLSHDGEMEIMPGSEFLLCLDSANSDIHEKVMNLTIGAIVQISYVHMNVFTGFKCEQERSVILLTQVSPEELYLDPVLEVEGLEEHLHEVKLFDLLSEAGQLSQVSDAVETSDTCCNPQESRFPHGESELWGFLHEFRMSHKDSEVLGVDKSYAMVGELSETGPGNTATEFETTATEGDASRIRTTLQEPKPQDFEQTLAASDRSARQLSHPFVPKYTYLGKQFGDDTSDQQDITTLMIRNIPNVYSRSMLVDELESLGFQGQYDFLYLPIDKSTQWNVGYAFVNFMDPKVAARCMDVMTNYTFCRFEHGTDKVGQISVAYIQGLEKNLDYYSNTAVRCSRRECHRPLVLTTSWPSESPAPPPRRRRKRRRNRKSRGAAHDTSPNPSDGEASSAGEGGSPKNANGTTPRTFFKARHPVTTEASDLK